MPDRWSRHKWDLLDIHADDPYNSTNLPAIVTTTNAESELTNSPVSTGYFFGLWDCDVLQTFGNWKAHILVTVREMHPVPGRVWMNWYNTDAWQGWKKHTPS